MRIKLNFLLFLGLIFGVFVGGDVFADEDINHIAANIERSTSGLPHLVTAISYLAGVLFAVLGILKTIDHVGNPNQTPIRVPVIRFLVGGGLFALPMILEAIAVTINGGNFASFSQENEVADDVLSVFSDLSYLSLGNFNQVLMQITQSIDHLPSLVSWVAYLLGLLLAVSALYKTRDHVDDPDRAPLKDAVIRYLAAGALFGLPVIYTAMYTTIAGDGLGVGGSAQYLALLAGIFDSTETGGGIIGGIISIFTGGGVSGPDCSPVSGIVGTFQTVGSWLGISDGPGSSGVGSVLCNTAMSAAAFPAFLVALSYLLGLIFGVWAILKIRDHVNNPAQVPLSDGVSRLVAGGAFFALPFVVMTIASSVTPVLLVGTVASGTNTGFQGEGAGGGSESVVDSLISLIPGFGDESGSASCGGLDGAMACFMNDILGPGHVLLNFFCISAGFIFIMIGISRLTRSAQEGAKGPGGMGTVATFVTGGVLISATTLLRAVSSSLFNSPITATNANLLYAEGMSAAETAATYNVINAVLKFMIIIGLVSFVRGVFIMRDVAEGSQQASAMAGMTHIIGGALAVNLGPVLNAVQASLGVASFGVAFS